MCWCCDECVYGVGGHVEFEEGRVGFERPFSRSEVKERPPRAEPSVRLREGRVIGGEVTVQRGGETLRSDIEVTAEVIESWLRHSRLRHATQSTTAAEVTVRVEVQGMGRRVMWRVAGEWSF